MDELGMTTVSQKAMLAQGAAELDPEDVDMNTKKALALGNALLVCMAVPWALCVIIYSGLHWTYPRDKARAMDLAMEEPSVHPEVDLQGCTIMSVGEELSCNLPIIDGKCKTSAWE